MLRILTFVQGATEQEEENRVGLQKDVTSMAYSLKGTCIYCEQLALSSKSQWLIRILISHSCVWHCLEQLCSKLQSPNLESLRISHQGFSMYPSMPFLYQEVEEVWVVGRSQGQEQHGPSQTRQTLLNALITDASFTSAYTTASISQS